MRGSAGRRAGSGWPEGGEDDCVDPGFPIFDRFVQAAGAHALDQAKTRPADITWAVLRAESMACRLLNAASAVGWPDAGHTFAAASYPKSAFTFTDAIAAVRRRFWIGDISHTYPRDRDVRKVPPDRLIRMADAVRFAPQCAKPS